jgi:hypothetical protein
MIAASPHFPCLIASVTAGNDARYGYERDQDVAELRVANEQPKREVAGLTAV